MMMSVLEKGRVGIAALAVGIAQAGLEAALDYAQTRKQFGAPIADNQGVQWMLADMVKEITAARALVHRAAVMIDNGEPANAACSMAKCYAGDMAVAQTANASRFSAARATSAALRWSGCTATPRSRRFTKARNRSSAPSSRAS